MHCRPNYSIISLSILLALTWLGAAWPTARALAGPTLLFDAGTGRILYAEDMDDQWHPASLTKMMTAYLTFQALKAGKVTLESPIAYSETAFAQPPSKIGLPVGSTITIDMALQALIVKSANDIAVALSEGIGGSEAQFVEMMNTMARSLGMSRTAFRNPHGLPASEQVTTARDLARLASAIGSEYPQYAHYWAQSQMQIANIRIVSHNGLFKTLEGMDGMKTGFICDSGYNIVASATRDGTRLMAVVLGEMSAAERNQRAQQLLEHGYVTSEWKAVLGLKDTISSRPQSGDAKDAASIRTSVVATECNNRRVARAAAVVRKRAKARNKAAAATKAAEKPAVVSPAQKAAAAPAPGGAVRAAAPAAAPAPAAPR